MPIPSSELILNSDGSIYHLNLLPQDIADTIITVGDPDRVENVTKYFDAIEVSKRKREFFTQTGNLNGKRITVISTGIGTDNIDIVLNELDALANINLETREINSKLKQLQIIRIGTSGSIQPDIDIDSFLVSELAIGFDSLLHYYHYEPEFKKLERSLEEQLKRHKKNSNPYVVSGDKDLFALFKNDGFISGITATNVGFYGPQGRTLRLKLADRDLNRRLTDLRLDNRRITNLEMETSGIYGMSKLLGHKAISLNAILANRTNGTFSKDPEKLTSKLIEHALKIITQS